MQFRLALAAALLLAIGACAQISGALNRDRETQQAQDVLPDGGPPVVNGFYDFEGSCPFEGCGLGDLYALVPVELLERPALDARVVATVQTGEWVSTRNSINRSRPARGVVIGEVRNLYSSGNGIPVLEVGDVVYVVDYEGEGVTRLWRRLTMPVIAPSRPRRERVTTCARTVSPWSAPPIARTSSITSKRAFSSVSRRSR